MEEKKKKLTFSRKVITVGNLPRIYIDPEPGKEDPSKEPDVATGESKKGKQGPLSFFGHHIAKLLTLDKGETEEFLSIDKELDSSLDAVQRKLKRSETAKALESDRVSKEELKHQRFIEERNRAQESMLEDILRYHADFETGLDAEMLWSLYDAMRNEANHEATCSLEETLHVHLECNVLTLLRRKAGQKAWQQLEGLMEGAGIPFPVSSSLLDPKDPERNEKVKEERKTASREDFIATRPQELAELILGNVPAWVYSYPAKDTYLWQLTALLGVGAGLAANLLMKYLAFWEENFSEILKKIEDEFMDRIRAVHKRVEAARDMSEAFSVSTEIQRISRDEIPEWIWRNISARVR
jgi:hypothetical protein